MDVLAVNPLVKDPGTGAHKVLVVEGAFTLGFPLRFLNDRRDGEAGHNRGVGLRQLDGHGVVVGGLDSGQKRPVDGSNVQVGIVNQTLERANDIGRGKVRTVMPFDILPQGKCDFRAVLRKRPAFRQAGGVISLVVRLHQHIKTHITGLIAGGVVGIQRIQGDQVFAQGNG